LLFLNAVEELCFADDAAEGCADFGWRDNDVDAGSGPGFYLVDCALAAASGVDLRRDGRFSGTP
jgi:hypothetical protein